MYFKFFLLLLLSFILSSDSQAQISVNDVIVQFKAGQRPVQNIVVKNSSADVFYVTATSEEIQDPGEEKSPLLPSEDLLVSPKRFSIDGHSERVIRLLSRNQSETKERVYRVTFTPQDRDFGQSVVKQFGERKTMLKILTGMGILVFIDPTIPNPDLKWTRQADSITFENLGNQHVRIMQGKACDSEGVGCVDLPTRRVYGGRKFVVKVAPGKTIYYTRRDGPSGDFKSLIIPP
jgi:P pilus assembly chaperone PapD